jgi:hypothetical protein
VNSATIEDARQVQRDFGLPDSHVIYVDIDSDWFVIAHTDAERACAAAVPLTRCALHRYLLAGGLDHRMCCAGREGHAPEFVFPSSGWYEVLGADDPAHARIRGLAL